MKPYQFIIAMIAILLFSACADTRYRPVAVDSNFGRSVQQVTHAQILNPQAAANPPLDTPKRMDGMVGQSNMNTYRDSFSQTQAVQPVTINIGSGSGGSSSGG